MQILGYNYLYGGAENEKLYGETGVDYLYGDAGTDVFEYRYGDSTTTTQDAIFKFEPHDIIQINGSITEFTLTKKATPETSNIPYAVGVKSEYVLQSPDGQFSIRIFSSTPLLDTQGIKVKSDSLGIPVNIKIS